ncbi:MAG: hypothetical protein NZM25_01370 [Leptospiraceae bacterium]|nr:hypothetical protein [Leptospiraceae bacterium]MDW8306375.1 hypothetical protein [Leptospiraceae bacterium]
MEASSNQVKVVVQYQPRCRFCSGYEEKIEKHLDDPLLMDIAEAKRQWIVATMEQAIREKGTAAAEVIFDSLKYDITEYILKHEFCSEHNLSVEMTLWLEGKKHPQAAAQLSNTLKSLLSTF